MRLLAWILGLFWSLIMASGLGVAGTALPLRLHSFIPEIRRSRQLIVVTTPGWNEAKATVQLFERPAMGLTPWQGLGKPFPAVAGARGWGWGIGLHGTGEPSASRKAEGDRRAPAGVFRIYSVFGLAPATRVRFLKLPYQQVTATTEAVDDPRSRYYNRIVDRALISNPDWSRSESMQRVGGRYRFGVMLEHNWGQVPGYGSCIFLHLWSGPDEGTLGCTAMSPPNLNRLLHWLDARKNPLVVQLPSKEYARLQGSWALPALYDPVTRQFPMGTAQHDHIAFLARGFLARHLVHEACCPALAAVRLHRDPKQRFIHHAFRSHI